MTRPSLKQPTRSAAVIDVSERTFEADVIARSRELPVVIDFWAPWCGPCRTLSPTLERLANEAGGAFVLAKVNVDENPRLAQAFQVQGIPAVKAIRDGQVVDEFTGALPESQVRAWLKRLIPAQADQLVAAAAALEASNPQEAAARYRVALGSDPRNVAALFGLGRLLLMQGEAEGAALLEEVPSDSPLYPRAQATLELASFFAVAQEPSNGQNDLETSYRLAAQQARAGHYDVAVDQLLAIVAHSRAFRQDGARKTLLALFAVLGDDHPLVLEGRRRLANVLF